MALVSFSICFSCGIFGGSIALKSRFKPVNCFGFKSSASTLLSANLTLMPNITSASSSFSLSSAICFLSSAIFSVSTTGVSCNYFSFSLNCFFMSASEPSGIGYTVVPPLVERPPVDLEPPPPVVIGVIPSPYICLFPSSIILVA